MGKELEELRKGFESCYNKHYSDLNPDGLTKEILSYLATQGVMIQTPSGMMMLSDLLKKEAEIGG